MNRQNIIEIAEKIREVGFEDATQCLVRHICFHPTQFVLRRALKKGSDNVLFHFYVQLQNETDAYALNYYEAILQREIALEEKINGVDIALLERRMAEIDWQDVFRFGKAEGVKSEGTKFWEEAEAIEGIIDDLNALEENGGSRVVLLLKQKYWTGSNCQLFVGATLSDKVSDEISQRFFIREGNVISADEAFRFLQNRRLEKEMQLTKRKQKQGGDGGQEQTQRQGYAKGVRHKRKKQEKVQNGKG
jgi:hypothetical protein